MFGSAVGCIIRCTVPVRFLKALSKDQDVAEEDCLAKIHQFLINFTATVDAIYEMYSIMNAELDYLV